MRVLPAAVAAALVACTPAPSAPGPLVPGLAKALPAVDEVRLQQGDTTLVFERQGEAWRIRDAAWRADRRWLQPLLLGLANARCDEPRTADPSRFGRVGVAWPVEGSGDGEASTDASNPPQDAAFARPTGRLDFRVDGRAVAVVVGYPQARGGTFVRVDGAPHSCLTSASLRLPAQASQWFDPQLWQVPIEQVTAVIVEEPGAPPLRLVRRDGRFVPDGAMLSPTPLPDALAAALAAPRQLDLRAATSAEAQRVLRLEGPEGGTFALALWRDGDASWARVVDAPAAEKAWYEGREFRLPVDVAEPLWAPREALGGR
ncbi:MAG: hypothetical protein ACRC2H_09000 [Silanimonas sp.]